MTNQRLQESVFTRHSNPCVERVRPYIPGPTSSMISVRYGIPPRNIVKISSNEAPLGPSPKVRAALKATADSDELHRFPSSTMPDLRKAIAATIGASPDQILLGAGSSDTWPLIVRGFSLPGDQVLVVEPSINSYAEVAILSERQARVVLEEFPFTLSVVEVLRAVAPETRVIFLSSPNNTTSRLIDINAIRQIAAGAPDAVVVVDEQFIEAADNYREVTAVNLIPTVPNLIVTRSLSKMYGLAGVRVGYAVGPEVAISTLMKFKPKWNINVLAEVAALAALEDQDHLAQNIAITRDGRAFLEKSLRAMEEIEVVPEAQGGFLLFRPLSRPAQDVVEHLFRRGIMVRGDLLEGYIRLSVGTPDQNEAFITALESAIKGK